MLPPEIILKNHTYVLLDSFSSGIMYSLALFRNKGASELVLEEFSMDCAFVQPRSVTNDTEEMMQSLCVPQDKQYLFERGSGRGHWRALVNGHTLQVPSLLSLKGNILRVSIPFILAATSFSQTQNLLYLKYGKTIVHWYFY